MEFSILDYERSIAFFDKMFGWLGYKSFWTLDIGYLYSWRGFPSIPGYLKWLGILKRLREEPPEWKSPPWKEGLRRLPSRKGQLLQKEK